MISASLLLKATLFLQRCYPEHWVIVSPQHSEPSHLARVCFDAGSRSWLASANIATGVWCPSRIGDKEVPGFQLPDSRDKFALALLATHSSTLAWKIPWMEEPGRLQSMGSLRVRHDWATSLSLSCIGWGNGNPLQCFCLDNPMDGGAWWAAVYGVAQSRTRLKRFSSSSMVIPSITPAPKKAFVSKNWNITLDLDGNLLLAWPHNVALRIWKQQTRFRENIRTCRNWKPASKKHRKAWSNRPALRSRGSMCPETQVPSLHFVQAQSSGL